MAEAGPHRRRNLLTGEWVLVSPQRTARPWQGQVEPVEIESRPAHDPDCYLCPGNERSGGLRMPKYRSTHVFDNDFPALLPDEAEVATAEPTGFLVAEPERGICRVVCYSPRHDLTLGEMDLDSVTDVVETWTEQYRELGGIGWVSNVLIFENRGSMMGASNPHPHGQIWADERLPNEVEKELQAQREHLESDGGCLLCRYVEVELASAERVVCENEGFVAVVPHWAVWPFETLILAKGHQGALTDLTGVEQRLLAELLGRLARRYDRLFA